MSLVITFYEFGFILKFTDVGLLLVERVLIGSVKLPSRPTMGIRRCIVPFIKLRMSWPFNLRFISLFHLLHVADLVILRWIVFIHVLNIKHSAYV